jgi:hypothetical protein
MLDQMFGHGNGPLQYLEVLLVYGAMFLLMRYANPRVELSFRRTYLVLFLGWSLIVFPGNYLFYRLGIMSFLPWADDFLHCFVWIGGCLGFLYAGACRKPLWEQVLLFTVFSFIVKAAERLLLGTWEMEGFFGFDGNVAYLLGWSAMDGLYPVISRAGIKLAARFVPGVIDPSLG